MPTLTFRPMGLGGAARRPVLLSNRAEPDAPILNVSADDARTALQLHRSALADAFPLASHYAAALVLHAFLEPTHASRRPPGDMAAGLGAAGLGAAGGGGGVRVDTLMHQQAWARVIGFPDTPLISGPTWVPHHLPSPPYVHASELISGPTWVPLLVPLDGMRALPYRRY